MYYKVRLYHTRMEMKTKVFKILVTASLSILMIMGTYAGNKENANHLDVAFFIS